MISKSVFIGAAGAAAAAAFLLAAPSAQAGVTFNSDLAAPGVYFGSGNGTSPQEFTVDTEGGVEIALRAKISGSQDGQIVPVGNTYFIPLGSTFNFDYSVNPDVGGSQVSLANAIASLTITNLANGHFFTFDPSAVGDNAHSALAPGGYQNSEKISFGFLDPTYNKNLDDTFHLTYTVSGLASGPLTVTNTVVLGAGAAVPEPASWALMILGFGGAGAALRRSRRVSAAATA